MSTTTTAAGVETAVKYGPGSTEIRMIQGRLISRQRRRCGLSGDDWYIWQELPTPQAAFVAPANVDYDAARRLEAAEGARRMAQPPQPVFTSPGRSPAERFRHVESECVRRGVLDMRPEDPVRDEVQELLRQGKPGQASLIRDKFPEPVVDVDPLGLFTTGLMVGIADTIFRLLHVHHEELDALVVRHRRGDFGIVGSSCSTVGIVGSGDITLTDDESWCPVLFSPWVQNHVAIATGSGLVLGKYPIFRPHLDTPHHQQSAGLGRSPHEPVRRTRDDELFVITLLSPNHAPKTMITSSRDPSRI